MRTLGILDWTRGLALFSLTGLIYAAVPKVEHVWADSVVWGESTQLKASVTDVDGNLSYVTFQVSGPGISGWTSPVNVTVAGSAAVAQLTWTPPSFGFYTISALAHDSTGASTKQGAVEIFVDRRTVGGVKIGANSASMLTHLGELRTQESASSTTVEAQPSGALILWSAGRVTLKPGFRANVGSFFWAAVDHDMDGYSDMEEATDTDGDGMFDAWEVDHGLNPIVFDANGDLDGDGMTNLAEFLAGRNPNDRNDAGSLPGTAQLIVKTTTGQFLGVNTTTWAISAANSP